MSCPNCGAELNKDNRFCTNCGTLTVSAPKHEAPDKTEASPAKKGGEMKIADVITIQDILRKDIDFEKSENELTPEQIAK